MKILLTGSTGMVGRNVLDSALASHYNWLTPNRSELNLLDRDGVLKFFKRNKPELIIHSAGRVGGIQANIKNPYEFLYENLMMGSNIIEAALRTETQGIINLGSSCMYPKGRNDALREDDILTGQLEPTNEGYALAKIAVSKLCEYATKTRDVQFKTIVPCNLYGKWDNFDPSGSHMIPAAIRKVHEAKVSGSNTVEIWGNGRARREFMYAGDLAQFILKSISRIEELPNYVNVGLGHDFSIQEYYDCISGIVGVESNYVYNLEKPTGMQRKLVNTENMDKLNLISRTSLKEGIKLTYQHFLEEERFLD